MRQKKFLPESEAWRLGACYTLGMETSTDTMTTLRTMTQRALAAWKAVGFPDEGPEAEAYAIRATMLADAIRARADGRWQHTLDKMLQKGIVLE